MPFEWFQLCAPLLLSGARQVSGAQRGARRERTHAAGNATLVASTPGVGGESRQAVERESRTGGDGETRGGGGGGEGASGASLA